MKAIAWGAIVILSVPQIIYRLVVPGVPGEPPNPIWLACTQVSLLLVLWVLTWVWSAVRPLHGFVLAILALCVGTFLIIPYVDRSAAWSSRIEQSTWWMRLVGGRLMVHLVLIALLALTLVRSGLGRRELFLVRGNPGAPAQPTRLLPGIRDEPKPWNRVVLQWLPYYIIIAVVILALQIRPNLSQISRALVFLPAIVTAAAINAFGEEVEFRSMLLARLESVLGPQSAILIAAGAFGLMHYFGAPGGPFGVVLAGYLGWIAAKSMIETRGFVWAFLIHFIADLIIYCFWAIV
jgi:membrane protease YdiL (CAAX protease family)